MMDEAELAHAIAVGHDTLYLARLRLVIDEDDDFMLPPGEDGCISHFMSGRSGHITLEQIETPIHDEFIIQHIMPVCSLERFTVAALGQDWWDSAQRVLAKEET
jgi:hypothetical protein